MIVEKIPKLPAKAIGMEDDATYWANYYRKEASKAAPALKPLGKPCHDCAVVCGFYTPYTDILAQQPLDVQRRVAERWDCHNHHDRACRGNIDRLGLAT